MCLGEIMSDRQKFAAALLCLIVVLATTVLLAAIALVTLTGHAQGDSFPGYALMALIGDNGLVAATKWLPAILGVGSALLAQDKTRDGTFWTMIAGAAIGALLSVILLVAFKTSTMVHRMCDLTDIASLTDPDTYRTRINWLFGGLAVWLGGVLAVQLGIKLSGTGEPK